MPRRRGTRVEVTPDLFPEMTFPDLVGYIERLSASGPEVLAGLAKLATKVPLDEIAVPGTQIGTFAIGTAMAATILAKEASLVSWVNTPTIQVNHLLSVELALRATGAELPDGRPVRDDAGRPNADRLDTLWIRVWGLQHLLQFASTVAIARTAILTGWGAWPDADIEPDPDLNAMCQATSGLTLEEYWALCIALWFGAQTQGVMSVDMFFRNVSDTRVRHAAERIVERLSMTPSAAASAIRNHLDRDLRGFAVAYQHFTRFPILRLDKGTMICAPHTLLKMVACWGPLHFARMESATHYGGPEALKWDNPFNQGVGARAEKLMAYWLRRAHPNWLEASGRPFSVNRDDRLPDFTAANGAEGKAIFVEVKSRMPAESLSVRPDLSDTPKAIREHFSAPLAQAVRAAARLECARGAGRVRADVSSLAEAARAAAMTVFVAVVPFHPPIFHIGRFRKHLHEGVQAILAQEDPSALDYLNARAKTGAVFLELMSYESIEFACGEDEPQPLTTWIERWTARHAEHARRVAAGEEVDPFLDLHSFIKSELKEPRAPLYRSVYDRVFEASRQLLFAQ